MCKNNLEGFTKDTDFNLTSETVSTEVSLRKSEATNQWNVHFLELHRWAAGPWRILPTLRCCPNPEHISPAEEKSIKQNICWQGNIRKKSSSITRLKCQQLVEIFLLKEWILGEFLGFRGFLTDSPGRGFSWVFVAASLASCSSLLSVWIAVRAESISMGPQASWAFKIRVQFQNHIFSSYCICFVLELWLK